MPIVVQFYTMYNYISMKNTIQAEQTIDPAGVYLTVISFVIWGTLPLYWKALSHVVPLEILFHRIFWCLIFTFIYLLVCGRVAVLKEIFADRKKTFSVFLRAVCLFFNWFIFIWAVNTDKVVETSLGYYINPLFSVILAMIFLKERLKPLQYGAFFLALIGVGVMTVQYGRIPWVALLLAFTFGMYGLLKKKTPLDSSGEIMAEMLFLTPPAIVYCALQLVKGESSFVFAGTGTSLLLVCAGIVTALPLILFGYGAKRIPLTAVGFIQYLAPTGMLLLGVFVFHEPFSALHLAGFSVIWIALILFTLSQMGVFNRRPCERRSG